MTLRRSLGAAAFAALAAAALIAGVHSAAPTAVRPEAGVGLRSFADCADLVSYLRPHAVTTARDYAGLWSDLAQDREDALISQYMPDPLFITYPDEPGFTAPPPGVEAPDNAKLDGDRLVMIDRGFLRILDVSGPRPALLGALALPDGGPLLVLPGHRVLVFGRPADQPWTPGREEGDAVLLLIDAADPAHPVVIRRERITGTVSSAGLRDGTVRLVIAGRPAHLLYEAPEGQDRDEAIERAGDIARRADAADLLPTREVSDAAGKVLTSGPLVDCAEIRAPARYAGLGVVSVRTIDTTKGAEALDDGRAFGVLGNGDLVHATADRVYVGTTRHQASTIDLDATTELHEFDSAGRYLSSGSVPGDVRGRYALSSHGGHLRVFTETAGHSGTDNRLLVLAAEGLTPEGALTGIWPNEQVRNVRWFAEGAAAVTEGQDPHALQFVDLARPTSPRAVPVELANFSGDLVVVDENRLVGTGADAAPKGGQDRHIQASAFDLTGARADPLTLDTGSTFNRELPLTYLPDHRLVLIGGVGPRPGSGGPCEPGQECRTYQSTVIGVGVDAAGRLRRIGAWVGLDPVLRVLSLGDRLVARTFETVQVLDPRDLRVLGSVTLPKSP